MVQGLGLVSVWVCVTLVSGKISHFHTGVASFPGSMGGAGRC